MGNIEYTRHAQRQMKLRRISREEVEEVLSNYHTFYTDRDGNAIYVGHPHGRRIKVVVKKGSEPPKVITAAN